MSLILKDEIDIKSSYLKFEIDEGVDMWNSQFGAVYIYQSNMGEKLSVESIGKRKDIKIYPNPSSDVIYFPTNINKKVIIYDVNGEIVLNKLVNNFLDVSNLSKGNYIIKIDGFKSLSFIKV